jgi:hypothetical protein
VASTSRSASYSYYHVLLNSTTTSSIYGKEKATVSLSGGRMAKVLGLILGCSTFEAGGSIDSNDGVLALGNSDISFGADRGEWRWRRCGRRRIEAATRTEARTEVATWMETPQWKVGAETWGQLTGPGRGATGAQARRRLLRLASSRGDESRENEIEFCVREE